MLSSLSSFFSSLDRWAWVALIGGALVIPGVLLEGAEYLVKWGKNKRFRRVFRWVIGVPTLLEYLCVAKTLKKLLLPVESLGFLILCVGLAVEIFGSFESDKVQSIENAKLIDEAGNATNMAAQAIAKAAKFDAARAEAERQTAVIQSNNLILQKELEPRVITLEQITNFMFLTEKIQKVPIKIFFMQGRNETANYAYQIRDMFNQAGFPPDSSANLWGLNADNAHIARLANIHDTKWYDLIFYVWGTNQTFSAVNFNFEETNGFARPIIDSTNCEMIGGGIMLGLRQLGFSIQEDADNTIVPNKGDIAFYVMDKAN